MSITSRINEMSTHIEQAYDELQGLGADLTNVNKNIENISMVLDDIYDSLPSVSGEGTSLTLDDTRVGKIKSTLKGNTSQTQYTGANILDVEHSAVESLSGITSVTKGNNFINGTTSATEWAGLQLVLTLEAGTYYYKHYTECTGTTNSNGLGTFRVNKDNQGGAVIINQNVTTNVLNRINSATFTITEAGQYVFVYRFGNATAKARNIIIKDIILSKTDVTYEPYVGGTASPNPSYPQPVNVVSGDNEIRITGRNQASSNFEDYTQYDAAYAVMPIHLKPNTQYTLNCRLIGEQKSNYYNYGIVKDGDRYSNFVGLTTTIQYSSGQGGMATFTTTSEWTNPKLVCYLGNSNQETKFNELFTNYEIEFVEGQPTTYEPYQDNTYNIDLPVENLLNLPNVSTTSNGITATITNGKLKIVGTTTTNWFPICNLNIPLESGAYTFSYTNKKVIRYNLNIKYADNTTQVIYGNAYSSTPITLNQKATITALFSDNNTTGATFDYEDYLMIEKGSKANSYTPYGTTPIELCKIGNYQDYFYKDSDKWYLHKEIGKYTFTGNETGVLQNSGKRFDITCLDNNMPICINNSTPSEVSQIYCNILLASSGASTWGGNQGISYNTGTNGQILVSISGVTTTQAYLSALKDNCCYYILATPTTIEVEYQSLIDQLNLLEKAMSKDGQTNISQVNNDLPFIISASAIVISEDLVVPDGMKFANSTLSQFTNLNTAQVTDMSYMFMECSSLTDVGEIDTSLVTNMSYMFQNCSSLESVPNLDTSNVTSMSGMFAGCVEIVNIPHLDTSNVTDMTGMFMECYQLENIPILNTANVISMTEMFNSCENLSDNSLNNILAMCANAINYEEAKILSNDDMEGNVGLGLSQEQIEKCKTLSNYQAFLNAGWRAV